jgi:hypothetical protein
MAKEETKQGEKGATAYKGDKEERGEAAPETTGKEKNFKGSPAEAQKEIKGITGHDLLGKTPGGAIDKTEAGGITGHHLLGLK